MAKTTKEMKLIPIDELIPYVNNARTHSPEQINKLRASLREFGFINPVIIDRDKNIIAGHGRDSAAGSSGHGAGTGRACHGGVRHLHCRLLCGS